MDNENEYGLPTTTQEDAARGLFVAVCFIGAGLLMLANWLFGWGL